MDEPGFHARRRADREQRETAKLGQLGGGQAETLPLTDAEQNGYVGAMPRPTRTMQPFLQVMCGPMLRYDTVTLHDNVYHAFAMIVVADNNSGYSPPPTLRLEWDADALAVAMGKLNIQPPHDSAPAANNRTVEGVKIFSYESPQSGKMSFWRFKIEIPMTSEEEQVFYSINGGPENNFAVPAIGQNFRWMGHSCNGFSAGVDVASFNGPSPLWEDVLRIHEKTPLHALIGGGDQLYCDPLTREPEIAPWINNPDEKAKVAAPMTQEMRLALDRYLFNHYCNWFRSGAFGRAVSCIPMVNMADDHDIIDGFGSYPNDLQSSPVFSEIGSRGYFWFLLFQTFTCDSFDGVRAETHPSKSIIFGGEGAYIPFPSHSTLCYLGPKVSMLLLDTRCERKREQIASPFTYERVFSAVRALPQEVEHLVILLGVPIAWPRMTLVEKVLDSKFNPMSLLAKNTSIGGGFLNKFNKEAELLDDLNDHWTSSNHKKERNWLIEQLQILSKETIIRVSFLSGDVHCAGVAVFHSTKHVDPALDPKHMMQIVSSAIVNTPPPVPVIMMTATLGKKTHKTLHHIHTDEDLLPHFAIDTDGKKLNHPSIMNRRNYVIGTIASDGSLVFDLKVEISQGSGTTKSYPASTPAPRW